MVLGTRWRAATLAAALVVVAPCAFAATAANTLINNTATASYVDPAGDPQTATSNTASVRVAELLDVAITDNGNVSVLTPQADRALSFTVTNTGNGTEPFRLAYAGIGGDTFNPESNTPRIYLDANANGTFELGTDTLYSPGSNDPVLAPSQQVTVFFVSNIPSAQANGATGVESLRATAATAYAAGATSGTTAGTVYGGAGDGGVDAVVGTTTASAVDQATYTVSATAVALTKSATVADPFGGTEVVPGSTITYTLTFSLSGSGSATGSQIVDPIPANTTYVPNSMKLNSVAISDAPSDDAGHFNNATTPARVEVTLPTPLAAPSTQVVTFKVTVN